jgi:hypothetical protein
VQADIIGCLIVRLRVIVLLLAFGQFTYLLYVDRKISRRVDPLDYPDKHLRYDPSFIRNTKLIILNY